MSSTIFPNICTNRRYESYANRSLSVCLANPPTDASLSPRLRTVSIIPGIENGAPERTDTSSGSTSSPRRLPILASSAASAAATSSSRPSGSFSWPAMYALHASVVIVKPGGTGRPSFVISARFAPLPPSRNFCSLEPSSKAYTYFTRVSRECSRRTGEKTSLPRPPPPAASASRVPGRQPSTTIVRANRSCSPW